MKHLTDSLPSILSLRPDLPAELDLVLGKAMAKDRAFRYASASELARDLRTVPGVGQDIAIHPTNPIVLPARAVRSEIATEVDTREPASYASVTPPALGPSQAIPPVSQTTNQPSIAATRSSGASSRRWLVIAALAGLGLILFVFCSSVGIFGTWLGLGLPGLFSPTPPPTSTATQSATQPAIQDVVLFSDDFSNPLSGWPTIRNSIGGYGYRDDGYHIFIDQPQEAFWAKTSREDANASVHVDARIVSGGANGYYGLLCRVRNDQNFYYFVIRSNGEYNIGKYKNGAFQPLLSNTWMQSDAIHQGSQTNRLRADCDDDTLRFYANDVSLGEVTDPDFSNGFSGLIAATLNVQRFEAVFNNFLITKPGQ